jgi:hypothetical protein
MFDNRRFEEAAQIRREVTLNAGAGILRQDRTATAPKLEFAFEA